MSSRWRSFDYGIFITIDSQQYMKHSYLAINPSWAILVNTSSANFALAYDDKIMKDDYYRYQLARDYCETLNPTHSVKTTDPSPTIYIKTTKKVNITKSGESWIATNKDGTKIYAGEIGETINYLIKTYDDRVLAITIYPAST